MTYETNATMNKRGPKATIGLFEIICLIVIVVSFSSIILLVLNRFDVFVAFSIAFVVLLAIFLKYKNDFSLGKILTKTNIMLLFILVFALVPRYKPHLYLYADVRDQAQYLIMSEAYAHTGSTFISDPVAVKINDTALQDYYELNNNRAFKHGHRNWAIHKQKNQRFAYEFRFYPLHSLWMSIFSRFFGDANRVYSLTFFSLISIIAFFLLALELSGGNIYAASIVGLIFAISDHHAFFSKSPVSEITNLALVGSSLYFLLKYYKAGQSQAQNTFHLFLSAGLIGCAFFTRITSFIYIAFFYFLVILTVIYLKKGNYKKNLLIYFATIFGLYALSLFYGKYYSHTYFWDVIQNGVARQLLGSGWRNTWYFAVAGIMGLPFMLNYVCGKKYTMIKRGKDFLSKYRAHILFAVSCLIIIYIIDKSLKIDFTNGEGLINLLPISFALVLFPALFIYSKKNFESFAMFSLIAIAAFAILPLGTSLTQTYSRYMLEILAFIFLICTLFIWELISKARYKIIRAVGILLLIIVVFEFTYHLKQYENIRYTDSIHEGFSELLTPITQDDLVIVNRQNFPFFELRNALDYYFHLNVFAVANLQDIGKLANYVQNYKSAFVLTQKEAPPDGLVLISKSNITQTIFNTTRGHPYETNDIKIQLYLYKLEK